MPADFQDLLVALLRGAGATLLITLISIPVASGVALIAGLARLSSSPLLRTPATIFVEIFRGTSLVVQLFLLFYLLPSYGVTLGSFETGVLALGLNFGAYGSEIVRSAVLSVDRGQRDAAVALSMPPFLMMRRVILPQVLVTMLPPAANSAIELLKATSLLSLIAVTDLALAGKVLVTNTGRAAEIYLLVLALYFAMAYPLSRLVRRLEKSSSARLRLGRAPQ